MKKQTKQTYKVGDEVILISKRPEKWSRLGGMDTYLGKTVTITDIDNNNFKFKDSSPWIFDLDDIAFLLSSSNMNYSKIETVINSLLKVNNTVTTLEVKTELRRNYPRQKWDQKLVSDIMDQMFNDKTLSFNSNGTYRVYSSVKPSISSPTVKQVVKTLTTKNVIVKKQKISKTKAIDLLTNTGGRYFGVTFTKKDGLIRKMTCKLEQEAKPSKLGYLTVVDVKESTPKSLNLQTLSEIRMNKVIYVVG
jgi:2',3'-cyclic-nucleotide 2'-phosphodiesterase (5'-nucleotidase family)